MELKNKTKFKETEIGTIPEEWEILRVSNVSLLITKGTTPTTIGGNFSNQGVRFIKVENLSDHGKILSDKLTYIDNKSNELLKRSILQENDVLYSIAGTIGRVAIVKKDFLPANINQAIAVIRPDFKKIDLDYFKYFLLSSFVKNNLASKIVQGVQANLSLRELGESILIYPKLTEQKKIAEILSSLDEKIELNRRINSNLEKIASLLFKQWFVDFEFPNENGEPYKSSGGKMIDSELGEIPEGWKISKIGDELNTILGGTPRRNNDDYWDNGNISWINSGAINNFPIIESSEFITKKGLDNSATKLMPVKTVVLPFVISLGKEIKISILGIETSGNQSVLGIIENERFSAEYIYYWIEKNKNSIYGWATGGAQQHINKQNVDETSILIPPKDIMDKFRIITVPIFDNIISNSILNKQVEKLRNSLLPRLMNGKIRVNKNYEQ